MWALKHSEINLGGPGVGNPRDAACCGQGWATMGYLYDPMRGICCTCLMAMRCFSHGDSQTSPEHIFLIFCLNTPQVSKDSKGKTQVLTQ